MKKVVPRIDEKKTKLALEEALIKYREYLLTFPADQLPKITASYSDMPSSPNNSFHSSTESIAIERALFEKERNDYMQKINRALRTLKPDEQKIVSDRYLIPEFRYDIDIWLDLNIGKTKYYKLKWQAMLRMAFALKIEVYQNEKGVASA